MEDNFRLVEYKNKKIHVRFMDKDKKYDDIVFTSLVIGPNGTGKTRLLSEISETLRFINELKTSDNKMKRNTFEKGLYLSYKIGKVLYEITYEEDLEIRKDEDIISVEEIDLPKRILAISFMVNDKFVFNDSRDLNDIYYYLGTRQTSNATFVNSITKKIIDILIKKTTNEVFLKKLKSVMKFLSLPPVMDIYFRLKSKQLFDKEKIIQKIHLEIAKQRRRFDYRSDKIKKLSDDYIEKLINFVKKDFNPKNLEEDSRFLVIKYSIDFKIPYKNNILSEHSDFLDTLVSLNILSQPNLLLYGDSPYGFDNASSGEKQFLYSMINILSHIDYGSLILLDEPEISFHPNWQIKYIKYIKEIFEEYKNCHFLIATHSHFMISDLEPGSSTIISLNFSKDKKGLEAKLHDENTFGWSVEDILYNIFGVVTTRNLYIADEIDGFLKKISMNEIDKINIQKELKKLSDINQNLKEVDPLKDVIKIIFDRFDYEK
ncbi:AAA family ATPase [Priestia sp. SIMBA_032]|uniref:AAA family ATPase n=1 Tax=Priestia sp. SIMBA_032 TaxID=3085775 RepID=UPI00397AFFE8